MSGYMATAITDDWATPQWLFDQYNQLYHFDLDAAASLTNRKVERYLGLDHVDPARRNGLEADWDGRNVWVNPPYGRGLRDWLAKAHHEAKTKIVVMLLPSRTDTVWFHDYAIHHKITFIRGRLKYGNGTNPAPFGSLILEMGVS